ncbi:MAG: hypothetical protein FJW79_10895 [Actinobacteria bacterium]|nr:hypothetical protein [Actinomycetota bacterium]
MPLWCIRRLASSPEQVFDAALDAAARLGFTVSLADRPAGHLFLSQEHGPRRTHRFTVSVTDSGLGATVLYVSWETHLSPWPRSDARAAARLCRAIEGALAGL